MVVGKLFDTIGLTCIFSSSIVSMRCLLFIWPTSRFLSRFMYSVSYMCTRFSSYRRTRSCISLCHLLINTKAPKSNHSNPQNDQTMSKLYELRLYTRLYINMRSGTRWFMRFRLMDLTLSVQRPKRVSEHSVRIILLLQFFEPCPIFTETSHDTSWRLLAAKELQ